MTVRYQVEVDLEIVTCCSCGTTFGVEATMHRQKLREQGKEFYCPNGHVQHYGDSEVSKLKKQLAVEAKNREVVETRLRQSKEEVTRQRQAVEHEQRRVSAYKGQITRTKNKIANGICPCCNVYFENLHTHMAETHPEYEATDEVETEKGMTIK